MDHARDTLSSLVPALAFLLAGVPLAVLLDRLGFFAAAARRVGRSGTSRLGLWVLAAFVTAVLNLDTTVVLLTPLYVRIAAVHDLDPLELASIPLVLAGLASAALPVSNLTTLIAGERLALPAFSVPAHLGVPTLVAVATGYVAHRVRFRDRPVDGGVDPSLAGHDKGRDALDPVPAPADRPAPPPGARDVLLVPARRPDTGVGPVGAAAIADDRTALRVGGAVVVFVLVGFVLGPVWGVPAFVVAAVADVALVVRTRSVPWRSVPLGTAGAVAVLAVVVGALVPAEVLAPVVAAGPGPGVAVAVGVATGTANAVDNLPAVLLGLDAGGGTVTWGLWAWLLGVSIGAVLLPVGALANLLWFRVVRAEGVRVGVRTFVGVTVPIVGPALVAATAVLVLESRWLAP